MKGSEIFLVIVLGMLILRHVLRYILKQSKQRQEKKQPATSVYDEVMDDFIETSNAPTPYVVEALTPNKPMVDPRLYAYLEARKFEHNLDNDFSESSEDIVEDNDEPNENLQYKIIGQGKIEKGNLWSFNDDVDRLSAPRSKFDIINLYKDPSDTFNRDLGNKGVAFNVWTVLIYPFFNNIRWYVGMNVFLCSTDRYKVTDEVICEILYDHYYFDVKGRFIFQEASKDLYPCVPRVGYVNDATQQIVKFAPLLDGYRLVRTISSFLALVEGAVVNKYQLIDNTGKILTDGHYKKILAEAGYKNAFLNNDNEVYLFHIPTGRMEKLPYQKILEINNGMVRVATTDAAGNEKVGIINNDGEVGIKPEYDDVQFSLVPGTFRVMKGNYDHLWTEAEYDIFDEVYGEDCYRGDFSGCFVNCKWGVIDAAGTEILPAVYDWVEDLERHFLVTNDTKLYYHSQDDSVERITVASSPWQVMDKDGKPVVEEQDNIYRLIDKYGPYVYGGNDAYKAYQANWDGGTVNDPGLEKRKLPSELDNR